MTTPDKPAAVAGNNTATTDDPSPDIPYDSGRPAFVPLEANPPLMTGLLHALGVSPALAVHDVFSLTEPDMLAFVPRPAMALLLVFPVSETYETHRVEEDAAVAPYNGRGPQEPVLWFRQTIRNACGLMGLLHATANGPARNFVEQDSPLHRLLAAAVPLGPEDRSHLLETSPDLAKAHANAARRGDTTAPDAADDIDLHYVCFVKTEDNTLWELDGRRKGPIARGTLGPQDDVLSEQALAWGPLAFLSRESADLRFSCVALGPSLD